MKVVFVTRGWPTKNNPMNGNYEAVQAKALAKKGIDVTVLCRGINNVDDYKRIDVINESGVTVYQYYPRQSQILRLLTLGLSNMWFNEKALYRAYQKYEDELGKPDLIHAHIIVVANHCHYLLKKRQIPFVITEHWSKINYPIRKEPRLLWWKRMYKKASKTIAVSSALAKSLEIKFNADSIVIGNMVESHYFEGMSQEKHDDNFVFITVGNLVKRKGYDLLINAFAKCSFPPNVYLYIVGGGKEYNNLKDQISRLMLQDQVKLLGLKTPVEVAQLLANSDCFVLSSHVETFGIVCIEAMTKGLPVIATACQGPEDYINESNGILVPVNDVSALTDAMNRMYRNIDNYDRNSIRQYCYDNYSESAIADKIIDIYNSVQ